MRVQAPWRMLAAAAFAALVVSGCSQKKTETETSKATEGAAPQAPAPSGHAPSETTATAAGSIREAWAEIAEQQYELSAVIQKGQLKAVHHIAFKIRDLVVALADEAGASSPAPAPKLAGQVEQLKTSATELAGLADTGDLKGTETEFAKLSAILDAIKATVGPA